MKLAQLIGLAFVLTGCAQVPVEHREPYKVVETDLSLRQVYEGMTKYPYCQYGIVVDGDFDSYANTFKIFYGFSPIFNSSPADYAEGYVNSSGKTVVELRNKRVIGSIVTISELSLNRALTGKCE